MKRKQAVVRLLAIVVMLAGLAGATHAATPEQIEQAVTDGVAWLVTQQHSGYWGDSGYAPAETCFALVKLEERAHDLGFASAFDPGYEYSANVAAAWQVVLTNWIYAQTLSLQVHGANSDDPDANANGYGLYFGSPGSTTYTTGICLMALSATGAPDRPNDGGRDFNGDNNVDTYQELAQDTVDWLAFAQADCGWPEGGWDYDARNNNCDRADQSVSGYATLGLAYGKNFGCTVPAWVHNELALWIGVIQNGDGGAGYTPGGGSSEYRTGNLIFQMCFNGLGVGDAVFDSAIGYIQNNWQNASVDPGWGYSQGPANYQAMYSLMKGLEYCGIDQLDTNGDTVPEDWFNQEPPAVPPGDFASVLVQQQAGDYWSGCQWGDPNLCSTWALLTLEKVAPVYCDPPTAVDFTWDPVSPFMKEPVTFVATAQGTEPIEYTWDFGNGTTATGQTVTHSWLWPKTYTVTLTATNECGQGTAQHTVTVRCGHPVLHVHNIVLSGYGNPTPPYRVQATVEIRDQNEKVVGGALVQAQFTKPGAFYIAQARTDPNGIATFNMQSRLRGVWQLCVVNVMKRSYLYDALMNHETCDLVTWP